MCKVKKYDIVLVDFKWAVGSEQAGIRPAVVVQNGSGNYFSTTTLVMPMTTSMTKSKLPTHTPIKCREETGLRVDSIVLGECVRQISEQRIIRTLGCIMDESERQEIKRVYYANFGDDSDTY